MVDQETGPLSIAEAVRALSQDDRVANPQQDNRAPEEDQSRELDEEQELAAGLAEEESDTPEEASDEEGPPEEEAEDQSEYGKGRFAADDAKTRLADGTVITVAELKKGSLLQSDYTTKTMAVAEERKAIEQYKAQVWEREQQLKQHGEVVAAVVQAFLPQPPDAAMIDPQSGNFDIVTYMARKEEYEKKSLIVQQLINQHQAMLARQATEQEQSRSQIRAKEAERLFERVPELAKPENYQRFWAEAVETVAEYGYSPEELDDVDDHRTYLVLRDAMAYRRLKARVGQAKIKVNGKPAVLSGSARRSPDMVRSHEAKAAMARLNKTGSVQDGIAAILALEKAKPR